MSNQPPSLNWQVYVVECSDATYYTGVSNDLEHRLSQHNLGKGAKYTRGRGPVKLIYSESCESHSAALKRECEIKKMSRSEKENLIFSQPQSSFSPLIL